MPSKEKSTLDSIQQLADQCVKCGLCLPYCPTYQLSEDENESPRGRIALTQALVSEKLTPTKKLSQHLENCLSCRHCERVCPAHVEYGKLITLTRKSLAEHPAKPIKHNFKTKTLSRLVQNKTMLGITGKMLRVIDVSGLRILGRYTGLTFLLGLRPLDKLLPKVPSQTAFKEIYPSLKHKQGSVGIFLGCLSRWSERQVTLASIQVLNHLGFDVHVPKIQGCCGAMAMHQGHLDQGKALLQKNVEAFGGNIDAIITTASGCGSMLQEASDYFPSNDYDRMSNQVTDISQFVLDKLNTEFTNLNLKIALHTPCTLQNCMKQSQAPIQLLNKIPGLDVTPLTESESCCGSAGSYMLENPEWSKALVHQLLDGINPDIDYVVTSNIGCALHISAALREKHLKIKVVHPIVLVAMAMGLQTN